MDDHAVREHAEAHGRAVLEGDLKRAASDLAGEARSQAPDVMARLPRPLRAIEVTSVRAVGEGFEALLVYRGESAETTVASRWAERDGRPLIVELAVR